jgi:DNA-directed RNA polymerase subunit M/transcription elongation factor TFIIS
MTERKPRRLAVTDTTPRLRTFPGDRTYEIAQRIRPAWNAQIGIRCPACGSGKHIVYNSRHAGGARRRSRQCACGYRFTTDERVRT